MASNRRKQDEKHLAILRNLVSLPGNKHCFDCSQRGPTYINTTIGSFVCTKCSGMLRGLTPPHRIKSISMATFTPEEIESLRNKGNDYCRKVWLALYDSNYEKDTKDEQHIQQFMSAKYEKKRYFIEPSPSLKNGISSLPHSDSVGWPSTDTQAWPSGNTKETAVWPRNNNGDIHSRQRSSGSSTVPVDNWPQPKVNSSPPAPLPPPVKPPPVQAPNMSMTATTNMFTPDRTETFKFPPVGEPFGSEGGAGVLSTNNQPSFANFDDNPIFSSPPAPSLPLSASFPSALRSMRPEEDKYAALKDLDFMMKKQNDPPTVSSSTAGNEWGDKLSTSNPFTALRSAASPVLGSSPSNPFRDAFDMSAGISTSPNQSPWTSSPFPAIPSSHTMSFPVTWNTANNLTVGPSRSANPFL